LQVGAAQPVAAAAEDHGAGHAEVEEEFSEERLVVDMRIEEAGNDEEEKSRFAGRLPLLPRHLFTNNLTLFGT